MLSRIGLCHRRCDVQGVVGAEGETGDRRDALRSHRSSPAVGSALSIWGETMAHATALHFHDLAVKWLERRYMVLQCWTT